MKRAALSLATALGALLAMTPGSASAVGETVLTYSGNPMAGSSITVTAAPGQANAVFWDVTDRCDGTLTRVCISDTAARITESPNTPNCNQVSTTQINCLAQGLRSVSVNTGDMDDRAAVGGGIDQTVDIADVILVMGPGNDTATISGNARVSGGRGKDKLRGRKGRQKLFGNQQNDRISCGKGKRDLGNGGGGDDQIAASCERIVNP